MFDGDAFSGGSGVIGATGYSSQGAGFYPDPGHLDQSPEQANKRREKTLNFVPYFCRQLLSARKSAESDGSLELNGVPVHNVHIVGKIVSRQDNANTNLFSVDDTTGVIDVKMWAQDAEYDFFRAHETEMGLRALVRVYGMLLPPENETGNPVIIAYRIAVTHSHEEILLHALQCFLCITEQRKGKSIRELAAPVQETANAAATSRSPGEGFGGPMGMPGMTKMHHAVVANPVQQEILNIIRELGGTDEAGAEVGVDAIYRELPHIARDAIRRECDALLTEVQIYTPSSAGGYRISS